MDLAFLLQHITQQPHRDKKGRMDADAELREKGAELAALLHKQLMSALLREAVIRYLDVLG